MKARPAQGSPKLEHERRGSAMVMESGGASLTERARESEVRSGEGVGSDEAYL
jgi:hypothetical protein